MKHVLVMASTGIIASIGIVGLFGEASPSPAAWALVIAGVAGSGFLGRRRTKPSIEIED